MQRFRFLYTVNNHTIKTALLISKNFEGLVLPESLAPTLAAFISSRKYSMKTSASFNAWPPRSPPDAVIDAEWTMSSAPLKMLLTRAVSYSCQRTDSSTSYTKYPTSKTCSSSYADCGRIFFFSRRFFAICCRSTDCIFQPIYISFGCPHTLPNSVSTVQLQKLVPKDKISVSLHLHLWHRQLQATLSGFQSLPKQLFCVINSGNV